MLINIKTVSYRKGKTYLELDGETNIYEGLYYLECVPSEEEIKQLESMVAILTKL